MSPSDTPKRLHALSANWLIRTLDPDDACESWCSWLMDARARANLNAAPRRLTLDDIRAYIASFDGRAAHIVGLFARDNGALIGIRNAYVDPQARECILNTLIGEPGARGRGANHESRFAMHDFVFEDLDLLSARASVVAGNDYMLRLLPRTGWVHEHTSMKPSAAGPGFVELHHFRLTREVWRAVEREKARALAEGRVYGPGREVA